MLRSSLLAFLYVSAFCCVTFAAKSNKETAFELFDSSFKSIFGNSYLINKQVLSGCFRGHLRGRFLWVHLDELPTPEDVRSGVGVASRELTVRYGEFFHRDNGGKPYVTFHGFDFENYFRKVQYSVICPQILGDSSALCERQNLDFESLNSYQRPPMVECLSIPEATQPPSK